jgi:16S rRNA (cytidine1402-2'-O)-methyltransferase
MNKPGTLYIIATPIGNLEDFTFRALRILKEEISIVYCEDTRQTRKLLQHYNITVETRSFHTHSSDKKLLEITTLLEKGSSIAYCTDSGTPSISDPGSKLVSAVRMNNIPVVPVPGPSALTTLVSASGFMEKNVIFGGFLSKKEGKRKNELSRLKECKGVIVIYESPYRIKKTLTAIQAVFGNVQVCIGREMTKMFEEFIVDTIDTIMENIDDLKEKGEFAVAILNE